jgi:hypothetical protein
MPLGPTFVSLALVSAQKALPRGPRGGLVSKDPKAEVEMTGEDAMTHLLWWLCLCGMSLIHRY